jgi:hypothetical protein
MHWNWEELALWFNRPSLYRSIARGDGDIRTDSEGRIFVGVSCNLAQPAYNCYPEVPADGGLFEELQRRAERTRDQIPRRVAGR